MAGNVCDNCAAPLQAGASIVFTPTNGDAKEKHLCMSCFEKAGDKENE